MADHCTCDSWFTTDQCKLSGGSNMSTQNHQDSLISLRLCFTCKISFLCRETQLCQIGCKQVSSLPSTALQGRSQPLGYPSVSSTRLLVCSKPCAVPLGTKEKPVLTLSFLLLWIQHFCLRSFPISLPTARLSGRLRWIHTSWGAGIQSFPQNRVPTSRRVSSQEKAASGVVMGLSTRRCKPDRYHTSSWPGPSSWEQRAVPCSSPFLPFDNEYFF